MLNIKIVGTDLPGLYFKGLSELEEYESDGPVYVGIQNGKNTIEFTKANSKSIKFECKIRVKQNPDGTPHFLGPFVQGKKGNQFIYLSWFIGKEDNIKNRFRRTKIMLNSLSWKLVNSALVSGKILTAKVRLTAEDGGPMCGANSNLNLKWS